MFFRISSKYKAHPILSRVFTGPLSVAVDNGWEADAEWIYKGIPGNYVRINLMTFDIEFDDCRSFPLFTDRNQTLTNIDCGLDPIWFDQYPVWNGTNWDIEYNQKHFDFLSGSKLTVDQAAERVVTEVCHKLAVINFDAPVYGADSHGVDTAVVLAAADKMGIDFELRSINSPSNSRMPWGYNQTYFQLDRCFLLTGFCGDEMLARNPFYVQAHYDHLNIEQEFDKKPECYMYQFFDKNYRHKMIEAKQVKTSLYDMAMNDYQMWHWNKVMTIVPFRSRSMFEIGANLSDEAVIAQVTDAAISKRAIEMMSPKWLDWILNTKNRPLGQSVEVGHT